MSFQKMCYRYWLRSGAYAFLGVVLLASQPTAASQTSRQQAAVSQTVKTKKQAGQVSQRQSATKQKNKKTVASKKALNRSDVLAAKKNKQRSSKALASGRKQTTKMAKAQASRTVSKRSARHDNRKLSASQRSIVVKTRPERSAVPAAQTFGLPRDERTRLREANDPLDLNSSVAFVVDQDTNEILFSKNDKAVLPIASLTKLMTGLVIADAQLPMDELITITDADVAVYRNSRLTVGAALSRGELLHLALMSSENRAANALGRTFPGGRDFFVHRMNAKAFELGMRDTRFVEPTGLSSDNRSSARDLAVLVSAAYERPILRDLSTSPSYQLDVGHRTLQYNNSNGLVRNPEWQIGLQKTGYISAAGRCLVMQAKVAGRKLIMVFLDSAGKLARIQDAERVRRWVEAQSIRQQFVRPQS